MARPPTVRPAPRPKRGFFAHRWYGEIDFGTLFWRDTILVGTLVNVVFAGVALALLAAGANTAIVFLVYVLPVPYNLLLFACVWRQAVDLGPFMAFAARCAVLGWLALAILL
ncbi:MAG: hypothetical protein ACK4U0_10365 [Mesorhizobium sp.]